ncbi:vitamin K epoxide reductase family protein [Actinoalloteichus hymeniacidonis]|uniref:Membrane protein n=1 Tax=Actinoalloteichus hymeniacidonis TaxID=340345 RepID=A0AAC9HUN5_9PSEU|nr:vitamin K epoxide reductase family protein [Actinoalloteichus hymeniacidonis]AOS65778.1 putative membrane protein [Actinoalloteichus hymeniacidonis]MBB5906131.1 putative membrane protein [Actinoalloteichus hymeniacidonis]
MTHQLADDGDLDTAEPAAEDSAAPTEPETAREQGVLGLAWLLTIGGTLGFVAAFVLLLERIQLLIDPMYIPTCSINSVLSCGSVMTTPQAAAFGFPNPIIGVAAFPVVMAVGAALLAGARFKRWFWLGLQAGTLFGVVFIHWLIFASLFDIRALCPYCMVVWAVTLPIFWYTTVANIRTGRLPLGGFGRMLVEYRHVVMTAWALAIVALVLQAFWSFWLSLF